MMKMLENIDAVIFDMDGTLLDSMWIWPDIDAVFLEKYAISTDGRDFFESSTAYFFLRESKIKTVD